MEAALVIIVICFSSRFQEAFDRESKKIEEFQSLLSAVMKTWTVSDLWVFDKICDIYKHHCPSHLKSKVSSLLPDMANRLLHKSRWDIFEVSAIKMKLK